MLNIDGKVFMNIQEAVGWLLANNALPFQSKANYAPNTEIAKTTIINPSPAQIKVGALVLFADSKVGTVSGITTNGFMVGSDYTDIKLALAYISNIAINASGKLISTLSDGTTIDAGRIKMISDFSINGSQHLIANYNDGTSTDLGAIFTGNLNIAGTINALSITGDSIVETMSGYSAVFRTRENATVTHVYTGICKNGNKLSLVDFFTIKRTGAIIANSFPNMTEFVIPSALGSRLIPYEFAAEEWTLLNSRVSCFSDETTHVEIPFYIRKSSNTSILIMLKGLDALTENTDYICRIEATFLLGTNLAS